MNIQKYQTELFRNLNYIFDKKEADEKSFILAYELDKRGQVNNFYEILELIKKGNLTNILHS